MPASSSSLHRVAIVTGGGPGLGRSTVTALAEAGVSTVFTYVSNKDEADAVVSLAQRTGARSAALPLDLGKVAGFDDFVEALRGALSEWGVDRFDYLVNNAGLSHHKPFDAVEEEELDQLYAVNFKGVFFLTQRLVRLINDGGRIVNIGSGLTRFWTPDSIPYASLKGAINVFTHYLAKELGGRSITVNTVAPGAIMTDFSGGAVRDDPAVQKQIAGMTALGRPGEPDDIGPMIASLLTGGNRWVTGQRIEVSGGMQL